MLDRLLSPISYFEDSYKTSLTASLVPELQTYTTMHGFLISSLRILKKNVADTKVSVNLTNPLCFSF